MNVVTVLGLILVVMILANVALFAFQILMVAHAWRQRRLMNYILHLEYFSLMNWSIIIPEGRFPTKETEVERFQKWRMN